MKRKRCTGKGGKRKRIRDKVKRAQQKGQQVDPNMLAACYGKIRFRSMEQAQEKLISSTQKAYKCRYCKYYHRGRKPS